MIALMLTLSSHTITITMTTAHGTHNLRIMRVLITALFLLAQEAQGLYLPGVDPNSFADGEAVRLKVNKMTSEKTLLPMDYKSLDFCQPDGGWRMDMDSQNLGEFLAGDLIQSSPYRLKMKVDMYCEQLCITNLGPEEVNGVSPNKLVDAIQKEYHNNWIVDDLPSASKTEDDFAGFAVLAKTRYWGGFPVGFIARDTKKAYIHNHVNIEIQYHIDEFQPGAARVVRFTVQPFSIKHNFEPIEISDYNDDDYDYNPFNVANIQHPIESCSPKIRSKKHTRYEMVYARGREPQPASGQVLFTYDVIWVENKELQWPSRWDVYLTMDNAIPDKVHWYSIVKSVSVVLVLSAIIVAVLVRNLRSYNLIATDEEGAESIEEVGWKVVHADVFRPPSFSPLLLAVCCGTGSQLLITAVMAILVSVLGVLSPANRGSLLMVLLFFYAINGSVAGYVTARFYRTFKGESWKKATVCTAFGFPGIAFSLFLIVDIMATLSQTSTYAVPAMVIVVLLFLWLGILTPLVFLGAYKGFKCDVIEFPVNTSSISREIPVQPWFRSLPFALAISGIFPFRACFVEMNFILASAWLDQYYYAAFGFLLIVFAILLILCAEMAVLLNFSQLKGENYHWWWRSFINGGSISLWVFLSSFVHFNLIIEAEASSTLILVVYFGYMGLASLGLFLMTGFVGISACLWFNKTMFASIVTGARLPSASHSTTDQEMITGAPMTTGSEGCIAAGISVT
mmetsp:Transcript_14605/g.26506  ORF Transcript_14605/g.26506 Transcript_14605/m.26506 type:complete len:736 (-) Transcript_14605:343-2550(-)